MSQVDKGADEVRLSLPNTPKSSIIDDIQTRRQNELLGVAFGIGMNVNNVIGSGIVTAPGIIWKSVKSPIIVLLLWFIGGIVSMSGSLSYVELGVIHKISGGETKYLQTAYPHPKLMMSYLFSFMFVFAIRPGILCAVLQSAAQYFWFTIRGHRYDEEIASGTIGWNLHFSPFWSIKFLAILFLLIITVYHMLSNKWANYINQTLAVIKLVTYSIIAIAGVYRLFADWETSRKNWQQPLGGNGNADVTAYSTSILLMMFSYDGWNNLNYSLDEFRKPEKKLIYSNSISVGIVTVVYLLVNIAFISVVPQGNIINNDKIDETIAATFFSQLFGGNFAIARIFTALVVLSVMGTAAVGVWSGSRVIVTAAKSNFFPVYSQKLRTWHYHFDTPINALFAQFIWCSLIIFFVGGSFTISSFTLFSSFSMYSYWIFYFATGIGVLVIRYRQNKRPILIGPTETLFKVPLTVAGIFILAGLFILTFSFVVDASCPNTVLTENCNEYSKKQRIQQMVPIFISYAFLFIALIFWYFLYYWWDTYKKNDMERKKLEEEADKEERERENEKGKEREKDNDEEIDISEFSPGPSSRNSMAQPLNRNQSQNRNQPLSRNNSQNRNQTINRNQSQNQNQSISRNYSQNQNQSNQSLSRSHSQNRNQPLSRNHPQNQNQNQSLSRSQSLNRNQSLDKKPLPQPRS